ncbi:NAD(P)-dependent alcohol dehydrogenase [Propioniciclava sp. MC1683]|uniref:NAD(P)-dependent alcohol dehydrogenase n=1 Tax=Propioniciclava sp. MC1683 TaxID=2760309 RepID=UPI0021077E23|nr:NAD(P)-dependent alcohol dehydrogenase [Propioniciclava sp. MC1683]
MTTYTRKVSAMRAAVHDTFGGPEVLRIEDRPIPTPSPREVLVRVVAASVNSADSRIRGRRFPRGFGGVAPLMFGVRLPRIPVLGGSFSGVVEAVGADVTGVAPGNVVAGTTGMAMGAHAEFVAVRADRVVSVPEGVSHDDAAGVIFGGLTALWFLRDRAEVQLGRSVLVVGASGAVGTMAVQLARLAGASVTGGCSAANADLVRSLGAERVIDHRAVDVTTLPDRFDVVLDAVGVLDRHTGRRLLTPDGVLLLAVASLADTVLARGNVKAGSGPERASDLAHLLDLVAKGEVRVVLDDVLPLDRIAEAHARVDSGRKVGSLIVRP